MSGFLGGVQGGYNWQVSNMVLGIEGEYTWADVSGSATTVSTVPGSWDLPATRRQDAGHCLSHWPRRLCRKQLAVLCQGRRRLGPGQLVAATINAAGTFFETTSSSTDRSGWVVGVGVEWGFAPNWSAKLEYDHLDFGSTNVTINTSLATQSFVRSSETSISSRRA